MHGKIESLWIHATAAGIMQRIKIVVGYIMLKPLHAWPTRHAGSQSNECNSIYTVFQIDKATKMSCHVSYDGGVHSNHQNADDEGWIALHDS